MRSYVDAFCDYDSDSDDEDDREYRFIKLFAPEERKQAADKKGLFPRKDFKSVRVEGRKGVGLEFPEYTIWEKLPWTEERQKYLDQWLKDFEALKLGLQDRGLYKALPCRSTSKYGHRNDRCHRYHSDQDMDHEAVAALEAAAEAEAAEAAAKAAEKAEEEARQRQAEEAAVEQARLAYKAVHDKEMARQHIVNKFVDEADAACRKRTKPKNRRPGPNDPVQWF